MSLESLVKTQEDRLLACVHCGFCLPACPTYTRLGDEADSPRGRLHLMRAVAEGRLDAASDAFQVHLDRCLGCRACETVCPSGVEYGLLLEQARARATAARRPPRSVRILPAVFGSGRPVQLLLALARLLRWTGIPRTVARTLPPWGPLASVRMGMAMLAASAPSRRLAEIRKGGRRGGGEDQREGGASASSPSGGSSSTPRPAPVGVLEGCVQAGLFGRVNRATRRVLAAAGIPVAEVPGQGCCGALHAHSGDLEGARRLARRNIACFEAAGAKGVVVNAAGCGAAMREYGHLLAEDPRWADRAARFSAGVRDVSEVLAGAPLPAGGPVDATATWDAPCHLLHAQRVADPPLQLLRQIPALRLVPLRGAEECCGGAGIYGITHPELGGRIGREKVAAVLETGAELVVTGNPGCMMQIGGGLILEGSRVEAVHLVELLELSLEQGGVAGGVG